MTEGSPSPSDGRNDVAGDASPSIPLWIRPTGSTQSPITDPGEAATAIDELPADLSVLRDASSQLVFHYRAGGDFAANGVAAERMAEVNTRYADAMFDLVLGLGQGALDRKRAPSERLVGCCRDSTVFFLAMARHKGMPSRARVGFATYLAPGWLIDHEIAEVWDERERRWRLVDPGMDAGWRPASEPSGAPVDWLDLTPEQFVVAPRAWEAARSGKADPERHVVDPQVPEPRGWWYMAHNVIHDLAALNKTELLLWDAWGMQLDLKPVPLADDQRAVIDEISAVTNGRSEDPVALAEVGGHAELRIPG